MRFEMRPVYIAEDGQEFNSEEMCLRHEARLGLIKFFDTYGYSSMQREDVVAIIDENFYDFVKVFNALAEIKCKT